MSPRKDHFGVAELKAHLSECLREVRKGHSVTVLDRDQPIARIIPIQGETPGLMIRSALSPLKDLVLPRPLPRKREVDSLAALLEERQSGR